MRALTLLAIVTSLGCGTSQWSRRGGQIPTLAVRAVDWNPTHAAVGKVAAVADVGSDVVVFGDLGVTLLAAGAAVPIDRNVRVWTTATTLPAPDGSGAWIVGLDGEGKVRRVRAKSTLEIVSERWGLGKTRVRSIASLGTGRIGFALDAGLALSDEHAVFHYAYPFTSIVGGGGRAASLVTHGIHVIDVGRGVDETFVLEGAQHLALDDKGRLYVATAHALYAQTASGELTLRYDSDRPLHALVASGSRVWFADGNQLGTIEGDRVAVSSSLAIAEDARLAASTSGDVWTLSAGALARFQATEDPASRWEATIRPIYARVCSACHGAGGSSGIDLSTANAWETRRASLRTRVLEQKTMPPASHTITDAERASIAGWLGG